jgi:hypothetical protein
MARETKS